MKVSVITPSFRNSEWLKLCVASVADQQGVALEHIVQDSCSDDGTQTWLPSDPRVRAFIEKDSGMYDALNRGLRRASGEILCHLNSDEQYLPGALHAVASAFSANPDADIVIAHVVVVDTQGQFICTRKSMIPWRVLQYVALPTNTAAVFFRRSSLLQHDLYFDTLWRGVADACWMRKALQCRLKFVLLDAFTSIFTESGDNLSLKPSFENERRKLHAMDPSWSRVLKWPLIQLHRARKLLSSGLNTPQLSYSIFTQASPGQRVTFNVARATGIWWDRHVRASSR